MAAHTNLPSPGGSPVLARRNITHLREGAAVPGYTGFHPTFKYMIGTSLGTGSHNIYMDRHGAPSPDQCYPGSASPPHSPTLVPVPNGGIRKYTQGMNPGYTGYIPTARFKYGSRYATTCETSLEEHLEGVQGREDERVRMRQYAHDSPRLVPRAGMMKVHMDGFETRSLNASPALNDLRMYSPPEHAKRGFLEAPKPGYTGYVPYIQHTDHGLGVRYSFASEHGLKAFAQHYKQQATAEQTPVALTRTPESRGNNTQRLYNHGGMKPKYTGYIPHSRFVIGKTYGNMVRESSACGHHSPSYGHHRREAEMHEREDNQNVGSPRPWQGDPKMSQ